MCSERSFKKGDYLVRQGDEGVGMFIIVSGRVKVVKETQGGESFDIASHGPGEFIGEMSVLDGAPRSASVVAQEDTTCLVLVSWDFRAFLKTHPVVALEILPVVVRRFRETNEKLIGLSRMQ
jgi:CRP-like cAMP-binding protein